LNQVISSTELNARSYISENNQTGKVVPFITPSIEVRGLRLPKEKPTEPIDIVLVCQTGEGVVILLLQRINHATNNCCEV